MVVRAWGRTIALPSGAAIEIAVRSFWWLPRSVCYLLPSLAKPGSRCLPLRMEMSLSLRAWRRRCRPLRSVLALTRISQHPSTRQLLHALLYPEASDRNAASRRIAVSERRIATERRPTERRPTERRPTERRPQHPCSRAATLCRVFPPCSY